MAIGMMSPVAGIRFGGQIFTEPALLPQTGASRLLDLPGLYVVLVHDPTWRPRPFRPLYFGESQGVWTRATWAHEKCVDWRQAAGLMTPLYRSVCLLPGWTVSQRRSAESALIAAYGPPCNERLSVDLGALLRRRVR